MHALVDADTILPSAIGFTATGYASIRLNGKEILLHRWIAGLALGRSLKSNELVHHVNYNKLDNRKKNLVICKEDSYHMILHARTDIILAGGHPDKHYVCNKCRELKELADFPKNKSHWNGYSHYCKICANSVRREKQYSKGKFGWLCRLQQQYRRLKNSYTKRDICWITKEDTCL